MIWRGRANTQIDGRSSFQLRPSRPGFVGTRTCQPASYVLDRRALQLRPDENREKFGTDVRVIYSHIELAVRPTVPWRFHHVLPKVIEANDPEPPYPSLFPSPLARLPRGFGILWREWWKNFRELSLAPFGHDITRRAFAMAHSNHLGFLGFFTDTTAHRARTVVMIVRSSSRQKTHLSLGTFTDTPRN